MVKFYPMGEKGPQFIIQTDESISDATLRAYGTSLANFFNRSDFEGIGQLNLTYNPEKKSCIWHFKGEDIPIEGATNAIDVAKTILRRLGGMPQEEKSRKRLLQSLENLREKLKKRGSKQLDRVEKAISEAKKAKTNQDIMKIMSVLLMEIESKKKER